MEELSCCALYLEDIGVTVCHWWLKSIILMVKPELSAIGQSLEESEDFAAVVD